MQFAVTQSVNAHHKSTVLLVNVIAEERSGV